ncbi:MAG: NAD(+)/NADH kinase [Candidatus Zipacnadales bacterium]
MGSSEHGHFAIRRIGLFVSVHRETACEAAKSLVPRLRKAGVCVQASQDVIQSTGVSCEVTAAEQVVEADLVIVLGGDGSLLHVARQAAPRGVPILGIDMGSFGFLADSKLEILQERLHEILEGTFQIEERLMLSASVQRKGGELGPWLGLNDAVIGALSYSHLIRFVISLDEEEVANYSADGLIVATPTGSTAYSLSAGGPLIDPRVESFVITPICPHTLQSRPVVVCPQVVVSIRVESNDPTESGAVLHVDGGREAELQSGDVVFVREAAYKARLVRVGVTTFYGRLRDKLHWGTSH